MANVKDLLVNGSARVIGTIYGNATSATDSDKLDGKHLNEIASAKSTTLAWNTSSTIATIGGNNITVTMPANPNTDTHWTTGITAGATGTTSNSATTNGNTFIKIKDNSTHRGQIKLIGSGATSVSSDANGVITINSTDNNTTYGSMSVSEGTTGTATSNRVLTAANLKGIINAHAPTKTGGGASGTWGISISGNAATATNADQLDGINANGFLRYSLVSSLDANGSLIGNCFYVSSANIANSAHTNHSALLNVNGLGTPFQLQIPDSSVLYVYKRWYSGGSWSGWKKISAGYADSAGNASSASKVNNKLTVGSKTYDGSDAVTIAASDLGLASAMLFLGTTTTAITDGATTNPVAIGGSNKTVTAGNVVLYGSKEFVWTGSAWEELGNEGSYKIVQAAVGDPSASGTSNTFIATISQDTNGKITATKKTVAVTNSAPTLAWGTTSTVGTVAGTNLQVKMPANPNVDTKVTQTVTTSNAAYPLLLAPNGQTATTTTTSYFDSGVTLNPSTNTIAANVSGNAATATKLATPRAINGTNFDGSAAITTANWGTARTLTIGNTGKSVNGSGNVSWSVDEIGALPKIIGYYGSNNDGTSGWYKVCTQSLSGYDDTVLNLLITQGYSRQACGLLHIHLRCDNGTAITIQSLKWLFRYGFNAGDVKIVTGNNTWSMYVQQTVTHYGRIQVEVLSKCGTSGETSFSLSNNTTKESNTPGGTAATDGATVNYANSSGSATKATQDSAGQQINTTYIKGLSVSGRTITYTKGNGSTGTITTQDTNTTYSNATTSANGLMSSADKLKLDDMGSVCTEAQIDAIFA